MYLRVCLILSGLALFAIGSVCSTPAMAEQYFDPVSKKWITYKASHWGGKAGKTFKPSPRYRRQSVSYRSGEEPGTVIIDTRKKYLYYVTSRNRAIRYGVGVGREGFGWSGVVKVGAKKQWPSWVPPKDMLKRQPDLPKFMAGGPKNPLGARAIYLFEGRKDTLYRIHGTNEPWTIGHNVSSGCIRMVNDDVIDLYEKVKVGSKVIVKESSGFAFFN